MSHEVFYRLCNFHLNILSSFDNIAKTLSVALEVLLSIFLFGSILPNLKGHQRGFSSRNRVAALKRIPIIHSADYIFLSVL